jgi:putative FmdB family regulatory protein
VPLYEYECDQGHRFELIRKFSDPPIEVCPTCGSPAHKLISSPAFQFKGSGWYITDYARKDSGGGKASESGEKTESQEKPGASEKDSEKDSKKDSKKDAATKKTDTTPATDTKSNT